MNEIRGFSIIMALFVLLVLGSLGLVMAQIATTQHLGLVLAQDGRQAYYAARSGLEWGRRQVQNGNCPASESFEVQGFSVSVMCELRATVTEGTERFDIYHLTSTATASAGAAGTVRRELQMGLWRQP